MASIYDRIVRTVDNLHHHLEDERGAIMEGGNTYNITKDLKYPRFECHRIISDGIYSGNKKSNKKEKERTCVN